MTFTYVAELLDVLGVPPERVRLRPPPGQATEDDLLDALEKRDCILELVDSTLVEKAVGFAASCISAEILCEVGGFAEEHDLGIVAGCRGTMRLREGIVRAPDVSFFYWEQFPGRLFPREPIPDLFPHLAAEVLREGNTPSETTRKLRDYFQAGTRLFWVVDLDRREVDVYRSPEVCVTLTEGQSLDGGDVLPGFTLPLAELFVNLWPKKTA